MTVRNSMGIVNRTAMNIKYSVSLFFLTGCDAFHATEVVVYNFCLIFYNAEYLISFLQLLT